MARRLPPPPPLAAAGAAAFFAAAAMSATERGGGGAPVCDMALRNTWTSERACAAAADASGSMTLTGR